METYYFGKLSILWSQSMNCCKNEATPKKHSSIALLYSNCVAFKMLKFPLIDAWKQKKEFN